MRQALKDEKGALHGTELGEVVSGWAWGRLHEVGDI